MVYIVPLKKKESRKQFEKLLNDLSSAKKTSPDAWNLFFGKVKIAGNPVTIQRRLRDEWE